MKKKSVAERLSLYQSYYGTVGNSSHDTSGKLSVTKSIQIIYNTLRYQIVEVRSDPVKRVLFRMTTNIRHFDQAHRVRTSPSRKVETCSVLAAVLISVFLLYFVLRIQRVKYL